MIEIETLAKPAHVELSGLLPGALMIAIYVGVIMLFLRWWLAFAVIMAERPDVIASLSRSAGLTQGRHWHILGALLSVMLIVIVVGLLASLLAIIPFFGGLASLAVNVIAAVFAAVIPAIGYCLLRGEKEGNRSF